VRFNATAGGPRRSLPIVVKLTVAGDHLTLDSPQSGAHAAPELPRRVTRSRAISRCGVFLTDPDSPRPQARIDRSKWSPRAVPSSTPSLAAGSSAATSRPRAASATGRARGVRPRSARDDEQPDARNDEFVTTRDRRRPGCVLPNARDRSAKVHVRDDNHAEHSGSSQLGARVPARMGPLRSSARQRGPGTYPGRDGVISELEPARLVRMITDRRRHPPPVPGGRGSNPWRAPQPADGNGASRPRRRSN